MQTLELNETNLRKGVDPEKDYLVLTDLNYEAFQKSYTAALIVYTSPAGKVTTLKNRFGGNYESREAN